MALFPFGLRLPLVRRPGHQALGGPLPRARGPEGRPLHACASCCATRGGARVSETKHFVLDGQAPAIRARAARAPPAPATRVRVAVAHRRGRDPALGAPRRRRAGAAALGRRQQALGGHAPRSRARSPGAQEVFFEAVDARQEPRLRPRRAGGAAVSADARRFAPCVLARSALAGLAAAARYVPWEDLTEADWLYAARHALRARRRPPRSTTRRPPPSWPRLSAGSRRRGACATWPRRGCALGDRAGRARGARALGRGRRARGLGRGGALGRRPRRHGARLPRRGRGPCPGLPERRAARPGRRARRWADAHPEAADPLALRQARARSSSPRRRRALEDWMRALEKAGRLAEADARPGAGRGPDRRAPPAAARPTSWPTTATPRAPSRSSTRRSWTTSPVSPDLRQAFAERADAGCPGAPEAWRAALERALRPARPRAPRHLLPGPGPRRRRRRPAAPGRAPLRGAASTARAGSCSRASTARSTRCPRPSARRLAAAQAGTAGAADRRPGRARPARAARRRPAAGLGHLQRRALPLDRAHRPHPGLLDRGASRSCSPARTGRTPWRASSPSPCPSAPSPRRAPWPRSWRAARPRIRELPAPAGRRSWRGTCERGEGQEALALLPAGRGRADVADEARRLALLAAPAGRRAASPRRCGSIRGCASAHAAPDGSPRPPAGRVEEPGEACYEPADPGRRRCSRTSARRSARPHRAALDLILGELDRLPDAEALWCDLAGAPRGLEPRRRPGPALRAGPRALPGAPAGGPGRPAGTRGARARRDLRPAGRRDRDPLPRRRDLSARARAPGTWRLAVPEQPRVGAACAWCPGPTGCGSKALERFPHSPEVFREALGRLMRRERLGEGPLAAASSASRAGDVVVDDALLDERYWAVLFADARSPRSVLGQAMRTARPRARLDGARVQAASAPRWSDLLLFEGWSRLSRFEQAAAARGPPRRRLSRRR